MGDTYAYIMAGVVVEIIPPFVDDVTDPENPRDVPIEERYPPDFVLLLRIVPAGTLVEHDGAQRPVGPNDLYNETTGVFSAPPPYVPPAPTLVQVLADRDARKAYATSMIDPLADAVELDEATPAEIAALTAWKKYRLALTRIEQQAGFHANVQWPVAPT